MAVFDETKRPGGTTSYPMAKVVLGLGGFVRVGVKYLVAVFRLIVFFESEVAAFGKYFYLLKLVRLGHREPDIKRLAGIGNANGERVIQLKVPRLGLAKRAQQRITAKARWGINSA